MGGDPTAETSSAIVDAVVRGGADIVELGIPFSDPIADGTSIQAAGVRALSSGTRPRDVLEIAKRAKEKHGLPIIIMSYFNILFSQGVENFMRQSRECGVDGMIVPDLPVDEVGPYSAVARRSVVDTILLAAPTTSPTRMKLLASHSSGFLYLVSLMGVTGARESLQEGAVSLVKYAKTYTGGKIPLAVGFGISKPEHVRAVLEAGAEGAIVGSGIVNQVGGYKNDTERMLQEIEDYVKSLKSASRGMG
jgi:tryptophan synthase alpha chain